MNSTLQSVLVGTVLCLVQFLAGLPWLVAFDPKVCRQLALRATSWLLAVAASMSISEEIGGRTAVTVMSKPVSRRHFLLGKFAGILLAAMLMTGLLAWIFEGMMWFKLWFDNETVTDPIWLESARAWLGPQ